MKSKKKEKPYWEMTAAELAEATREFDKPVPFAKTRPLTKEEAKEFERLRRSPHMSVFITRGSDATFVRIEPDLLERCTRYAAEHGMTLSEVINRSLKGMLTMVE
jgi:hypothetical protein